MSHDRRMPTLPEQIPNDRLEPERIPSQEAPWSEIVKFAHTFDGDRHWGSRTACAKIANERRHETLTDLRTCLFFEQRRWNHYGRAPDLLAMDYIRDLLREIRERLAKGDCNGA
jgi:hypothetical protein